MELHLVAAGKSLPAMTANAAELIALAPFRIVDFGADHLPGPRLPPDRHRRRPLTIVGYR